MDSVSFFFFLFYFLFSVFIFVYFYFIILIFCLSIMERFSNLILYRPLSPPPPPPSDKPQRYYDWCICYKVRTGGTGRAVKFRHSHGGAIDLASKDEKSTE